MVLGIIGVLVFMVKIVFFCCIVLCSLSLYAKANIIGEAMKISHGFIVNGQSSFDGEIKGFDCKTDFKKTGSVIHRYDSVFCEEQTNLEYKQVVKIENFTGKIKYYHTEWCEEFKPAYWTYKDNPFNIYGYGKTTSLFYPYLFIENKGEYCAFNLVPTGDWKLDIFMEGSTLNIVAGKDNYIPIKEKLPACDEIFLVEGTDENQVYMDQQNYVRDNYWHGEKVSCSYNTWIDQFFILDWDNLIKQINCQADLGTEVFIIDAGWFGRLPAWQEIGQWEEKEDLFGKGKTLLDLANYVRSKGMKFGIWMEVMKVHEKSDLFVKYPDLFVKTAIYTEADPYYHYDFNNPKAMDLMFNEVCKIIDKYKVEWIKIDNNAPRLKTKGDPIIIGTLAYWGFLDRLKKKYPNLTVENCAGGGSENDINTISRSHINAQTDTVYSLELLRMMSESFKVYPPCFANNWACLHPINHTYTIMDKPAHNTRGIGLNPKDGACRGMDALPIDYVLATCFPGNLSMTGNFADFDSEDREIMKKILKIYKDNKDFIMKANYLQIKSDRCQAFILTKDFNEILLFIFENSEEHWTYAKRVNADLSLIPHGKYDCVNLITGEKEELGSVFNEVMQYRDLKIYKLTKID